MTGLRKAIRRIGLDPADLNLARLQERAEAAYNEGAEPIEAYSRALGCDLTLPSHGGAS